MHSNLVPPPTSPSPASLKSRDLTVRLEVIIPTLPPMLPELPPQPMVQQQRALTLLLLAATVEAVVAEAEAMPTLKALAKTLLVVLMVPKRPMLQRLPSLVPWLSLSVLHLHSCFKNIDLYLKLFIPHGTLSLWPTLYHFFLFSLSLAQMVCHYQGQFVNLARSSQSLVKFCLLLHTSIHTF